MEPARDLAGTGPVWLAEERVFVERVTRYARLATWLMALSIAVVFFSIAVSVASHEFGVAPSGMPADAFADLLWSSAGIPLHEHP